MSAPSACLLFVVVAVTVFLTLHYTSSTLTMQEIVISAEPTGPPVKAAPSPSQSSPTHAVIPDGSVVFR